MPNNKLVRSVSLLLDKIRENINHDVLKCLQLII
jgi:hypothetical protein